MARKRSGRRDGEVFATNRGLPRDGVLATVAVLALALSMPWWGLDSLYTLHSTISRSILAPLGLDRASNGVEYFPVGCRWRDVETPGKEADFWEVRNYEYWDDAAQSWSTQQPAACRIEVPPQQGNVLWTKDSRTSISCKEGHCILENLWYNDGTFYYLNDHEDGLDVVSVTRDVDVSPLTVRRAAKFGSTVDSRMVTGDTLLIDFVYFIHPTAIGHWLEHLMPLVSALRFEPSFAAPPNQILLLHLKRTHIMAWVRNALAAAIGIEPGTALPPVYMQREISSMWDQIGTPLEGVPRGKWLCFERVLAVKDVFTGGGRVALTAQDVAMFRERSFRLQGLSVSPSVPRDQLKIPRSITLLRKSRDRRILNEKEVVRLLRRYAPVRIVEFTATTLVAEQLRIMASTGVLVGTHTSALANCVFLPPGAAVIELIHRNWAWDNMDRSFKVHSEAAGDKHHWAWRATARHHSVYLNPRDEMRFGGDEWAGEKCDTDECVEAHTNVDVVVDIKALEHLLDDRLPAVWGGVPVGEAELPWPSA